MNQQQPRIFVTHTEETQYESRIQDFLEYLHTKQVEVIVDDCHSHFETEMIEELQRCNWFILLQTPGAVVLPHVRMITYAAITLARKGSLQGFRYVIEPISPSELPQEWEDGLIAIDATQDNPPEQLIQLLFGKTPVSETEISSTQPESLSPSDSALASTFLQSALLQHSSPSPTTIEHNNSPEMSPSGKHFPLPFKDQFLRKISRPRLLTLAIAALIILLLLSLLLARSFLPPVSSQPSLIGDVHFTSSNLLDPSNIQGLNDGIQGDLAHLPPTDPGKSYYAWLLPDITNGEGPTVPIGKLSVSSQGTAHIDWHDPDHTDLLATSSQFLITEEAANTPPILPTPDKTAWRYYAEIPQTPNPKNTMGNMSNMSLLTHLRHLLVSEPHLEMDNLHGGLVTWLQQYIRKTLEWSNAARSIGTPTNPGLMHRHFIRILDYLDGDQYVETNGDVPGGTPVIIDAPIGLLTFDPAHQDPPGYVMHIGIHLQALVTCPGATPSQQALATLVNTALNGITGNLDNARQDATQLVRMSDTQLLDPGTVPLLDDLVTQTENAYIGVYNPTTSTREGGTIWVHDQIEHLASFPVMTYSGTQFTSKSNM